MRGVHKGESGETVPVRRGGRKPRRPKTPESPTSTDSKEQTPKSTYRRRPSTPSSSDEALSSRVTALDPNGETDHVDASVSSEAQSYTESPVSPIMTTGVAAWHPIDTADQFGSPIPSPTTQAELMTPGIGIGTLDETPSRRGS